MYYYIAAGKSAAVPLGYEAGRVSIRPDDDNYSWSVAADAVELPELKDLETYNKVL